MEPTRFFRACIVASLAITLVAGFIDAIFPGLVPAPLREVQELIASDSWELQDWLLLGIGVPVLVAYLIAAVGLYSFRSWAPRLALWATIGSFVLYAFTGAQVYSPLTAVLEQIAATLWGIVLAMSFLPPLNARFSSTPAHRE